MTNSLQYLTIPTIPTLPYSCNKYCDLIGHSVARGCSIPRKIKDRLLINQIPDLHYPTISYNTLQYLHYPIYVVVTNTVIRLVTRRPEAIAKQSDVYSGVQYCE